MKKKKKTNSQWSGRDVMESLISSPYGMKPGCTCPRSKSESYEGNG